MKDDWYTIEEHGAGYLVRKVDEDCNSSGQPYEIKADRERLHCSCYAGLAGKDCRHLQMLRLFKACGNIGAGIPFNFDRREWMKFGEIDI